MKRRLIFVLIGILLLTACTEGPEPAGQTAAPSPEASETAAPEQTAARDPQYAAFTMLGLTGDWTQEPEQDLLTPIWREKTGVQMQTVAVREYETYDGYLENALEEGTLPDVLAVSDGVLNVPERLALLTDSGSLKAIDYDTARAAMPLTAQRLKKMGVSFEDWFSANAFEDGLWYYVPQLPSPLYDERIRGTRFGVDQTPLELSYFWVRDDWLTSVNSYAADELSFVRLYEVFADNMTIEQVCDFQPTTLGDWSRFFEDIADFAYATFQVVTPAMLTYGDSAGSVVWSLYGAGGLCWQDELAEFPNDLKSGGDHFSYYAGTQGWKDYIQWLNACVSADYTDLTYAVEPKVVRPELFAEAYAVLNQWIDPPNGTSPITGVPFGWRYYPVLTDSVLNGLQDNSVTYLTLATDGAVAFNAQTVSDEELQLLLGWVDWNYSLEAAQLRQWGVDLSDGEGSERRFRYEYGDLARAMLGDADNQEVAWQYGMINTLCDRKGYWNHEVYGVGAQATDQHPFYVYPLSEIPYDQQYFVTYVVKDYLLDLVLQMQYVPVRDDAGYRRAMADLSEALDAFKQEFAQEAALEQQQALCKAILAPPEEFDAAYEQYLDVYERSAAKRDYEETIRALLRAAAAAIR